ncbi:hypothetical protein [uncultured Arcobacter sp.]|uniref:hypothetical protein n=1 Tax=uncultured Arcobacter sp. TaxID=165434 RepID=UPI0026362D0B|nr:hypothetical protein [uncultured Arcobacter sp.]
MTEKDWYTKIGKMKDHSKRKQYKFGIYGLSSDKLWKRDVSKRRRTKFKNVINRIKNDILDIDDMVWNEKNQSVSDIWEIY